MTMPGFSAEAALLPTVGHYRSVGGQSPGDADRGIAPQMLAGSSAIARSPFSGSCMCGPGYCCCIFCYFNSCYFWCWSSVLAQGQSSID